MNKLILCCGLLSAAAFASAFTPPFENLKINRNDNSVQIAYGPQKSFSAGGAIFPKELSDLVTISEEDKSLVIDTTQVFRSPFSLKAMHWTKTANANITGKIKTPSPSGGNKPYHSIRSSPNPFPGFRSASRSAEEQYSIYTKFSASQ